MDSNHRSRRQQIYSLPPLATRESLHIQFIQHGADRENRTPNLLITNQLRCQLRHVGMKRKYYYTGRDTFCQAFFLIFQKIA